ncbi:hypothetical protein [Kitasatospora purpeofusca]|uniref:hypothetical protein n=1 Tax=Kitasatospora purpeofusca TaxID=67352 RepID=UPI00364F2E7C
MDRLVAVPGWEQIEHWPERLGPGKMDVQPIRQRTYIDDAERSRARINLSCGSGDHREKERFEERLCFRGPRNETREVVELADAEPDHFERLLGEVGTRGCCLLVHHDRFHSGEVRCPDPARTDAKT